MKNIKISKQIFKKLMDLRKFFYEIYGNEKTVWDFDDLNEMREIGQEFMDIFVINSKK